MAQCDAGESEGTVGFTGVWAKPLRMTETPNITESSSNLRGSLVRVSEKDKGSDSIPNKHNTGSSKTYYNVFCFK